MKIIETVILPITISISKAVAESIRSRTTEKEIEKIYATKHKTLCKLWMR